MSGALQLRLVVTVFCFLGTANLGMAIVQLGLGQTPPLAPALGGAGYVLAAWQLWRGSAIAQFVLAVLGAIAMVLTTLMGLLIMSKLPFNALLLFTFSGLNLLCVYLLLFSRPLKTELKSRRVLNLEADRIAFERSMSES